MGNEGEGARGKTWAKERRSFFTMKGLFLCGSSFFSSLSVSFSCGLDLSGTALRKERRRGEKPRYP